MDNDYALDISQIIRRETAGILKYLPVGPQEEAQSGGVFWLGWCWDGLGRMSEPTKCPLTLQLTSLNSDRNRP